MGTNSADLQPDQSNSTPMSLPATVSLRCVECATLYPAVENQPRYRCDCGGVLDVEMIPQPALREAFEAPQLLRVNLHLYRVLTGDNFLTSAPRFP